MKESFVYFIKPIGMDGPIKIGHSDAPVRRLEGLAAWSPWPLEIIGTVAGTLKDEQFLHRCFADLHSHHEWFRTNRHLRTIIERILKAETIDVVRDELVEKGSIRRPRNFSEDRRKYMSFVTRVRCAVDRYRVSTDTEHVYFSEPSDVAAIMRRWSGSQREDLAPVAPTDEEIQRLEAFVASPLDTATRHVAPAVPPAPQLQTEGCAA